MGFRMPAVAVSPYSRGRSAGAAGWHQRLPRRPRRVRPRVDPEADLVPVRARRPDQAHDAAAQHRPQLRLGAPRLRDRRRCPTRPRSPPRRARSAAATCSTARRRTRATWPRSRTLAERYGVPVYEGKPGDIFTLPDTISRAVAPQRRSGRVSRAHGDAAADRRRAGRRRRRRARRREPRDRGDARDRRRRRPPSSSTRRWPPPREACAGVGARPRRSSARSCCTRSPRGCARTPTSSRGSMTLEGGKPLVENSDEVGWTAAAFDYYAEMGRNFAGRVIPSIESTQLALVVKEPIGVVGVHRALELPAAAAGLEAGAGARGRQHGGREAVGADAAVDADAGASASPSCRRAWSTCSPGGRRRRRGARRATSASTASPSRARSRPARRSPPPAPSVWRG